MCGVALRCVCVALRCVALRCLALPCLALPCLALPCLALPCLALPLLALPCLALPCLALPCLALPCPALPCLALPCVALSCVALRCVMLCGGAVRCGSTVLYLVKPAKLLWSVAHWAWSDQPLLSCACRSCRAMTKTTTCCFVLSFQRMSVPSSTKQRPKGLKTKQSLQPLLRARVHSWEHK